MKKYIIYAILFLVITFTGFAYVIALFTSPYSLLLIKVFIGLVVLLGSIISLTIAISLLLHPPPDVEQIIEKIERAGKNE